MTAPSIISPALARYRKHREPFWAMGSQVITSAANFLTSVIIIHTAGLEEFGRFSFCFFVIMITRKFLIGVVLTPMSSILPTIENEAIPEYRFFLFCYTGAFSTLASLLLLVLSPAAAVLLDAPWLPDYLLPFVVANALANFSDFIRRLHLDSKQPIASFMVDICRFSLQLAAMAAVAYTWHGHFTANSALWIMAASSLAGILTGLVGIGDLNAVGGQFRRFWERHRSYAGWMSLSMLLEVVQSSVPMFIAMAILGEAALGTLRALQQFANLLNLPFNALLQVMPSIAARSYAADGMAGMRKVLIGLTGTSVLAITALSLLTTVVSGLVIRKGMGIDDPSATPIFLAFMALNIVMLVRLPFFVAYTVIGKPHAVTLSNVVGAVLACLGTFYLTRAWGPIAVPLVTAAGLAIATLFFIFNRESRARETEA